MDKTERQLWRRADAVLGSLLELDFEERLSKLGSLGLEPDVHDRVAALLDAAHDQGGPLDHPPKLPSRQEITGSLRGFEMGPWKLGEELGRGGMGVVHRATRRRAGFEQTAALKVLRVEFSDPSAIERFRREQRFLATFRHPNIASFIDGGVSRDGTPYLVIEEVRGVSIDRHCEGLGLTAREIVRLFLQVCDAVAHAHRNLIVHRDLKPENILVDEDGRARLLDFGVAKLLGPDTHEGRATRVLTPAYGAPEQASGGAVTTATDVYGLGAVLFRLLAGEPQRGDEGENRSLRVPSSAAGAVEGIDADLENAVSMAIREEPERRYASAGAFAADLGAWLDGRPLEATPDSFRYRMAKAVARHRTATVAVSLACFFLLAGSGVALWQAAVAGAESQRARAAESEARRQLGRAEAVTAFLASTFGAADATATHSDEITAREILEAGARRIEEDLAGDEQTRRHMRSVLGQISYNLGDLRRAEALLSANLAGADGGAGMLFQDLLFAAKTASAAGDYAAAERRFRRAEGLAGSVAVEARVNLELAWTHHLVNSSQTERARLSLQRLLESPRSRRAAPEKRASASVALASILEQQGRYVEARTWAEESTALLEPAADAHPVELSKARGVLANIEARLGQLEHAARLKEQAFAVQLDILGPRHPVTLVSHNDLATLEKNLGRFEASAGSLADLLDRQIQALGRDHPNVATTRFNLSQSLVLAGRRGEALRHLEAAVRRAEEDPAAFGARRGVFRAVYGRTLAAVGRGPEGERELRRGLELVVEEVGPKHPLACRLRVELAGFLVDGGRFEEALDYLQEAIPELESAHGNESRELALGQFHMGRALLGLGASGARAHLGRAVDSLRRSPFR
ncbi:MAG: protein kinase, partial [Acidobacteriota bacterium]